MGYTSMISWIPMFMVRIMGWTSTEVGAYMGPAYLITGLLITPFSGWLSDRLGLWSRRTRAWLGVPCFLILLRCLRRASTIRLPPAARSECFCSSFP